MMCSLSTMDYLRRWLDRLGAHAAARPTAKLILATLGLLVALTAVATLVHPSQTILVAFYAPLFGVLLLLVLRRMRFDGGTTFIIVVAYGLYLAYLTYTDYAERNYDGPAQVEYIRYIIEYRAYPSATQCFICHHPPLYYALAAIPYAFFQRTRLLPPEVGLQLFSLGLFLAFLVFSVQIVRRFTTDVRSIRLAAALVAFWPSSFVNCVRVHNDTLVTTLMVVALYFTICWQQESKPRDLLLAAGAAAFAVLTKSSGFVVVAMLFALVGHRLIVSPHRLRQLRRAAIALAMVGSAMLVNTLRKSEEMSATDSPRATLCQKLLGPVCDIYPAQWVDNDPAHYVWFDVRRFLDEPYLIRDRGDISRQYFLNHLVKSSLFGTHYTVADRETSYELNAHVAAIMNWLVLGMMGYLVVAFGHLDRCRLRRYGVVLLGVGLFVAFAAASGFLIPAPHHLDFRHIYPVLALVSLAYASAVGFFRTRRSVLAPVGYALAGSFLALSIFYFWPKYDWAVRLMARTVPADLAAYDKVVREMTSWDKPSNLLIEGNNTIEFRVSPRQTVNEIDISVDNNDTYEIVLVGVNETRTVSVGPSPDVKGLARYIQMMEPPVEQVEKATLRVIRGDRIYAMGHFILR